MIRSLSGNLLFPLALGALLAIFLGLWVITEIMGFQAAGRGARPLSPEAVAQIAEPLAIRVPLAGEEEEASLRLCLEEMIASAGVRYIRIERGGRTLLEVGPGSVPERILGAGRGRAIHQGLLYLWRELRWQAEDVPPGEGRSGRLILVFDTRGADDGAVPRGGFVFTVLVLVCTGAAAISLLVYYLLRNYRLQHELKLSTRRRGQVEELSLAAAGLAHETKNPLGIIRGLAQQIAADEANSDQAREKAREIMEEADVTASRLGEFLSYAKLREPEFADVDLEEHVGRLARLLEDDFHRGDIEFRMHVGRVVVRADAEMLSQVLLNLLSNSLKSTPPGGIISVTSKQDRRKRVSLEVADTGAGIAEQFIPNMFKPYTSKRPGGYGIGLAIVRKIVERSGWEIRVHSREGEGTRITIGNMETVGTKET